MKVMTRFLTVVVLTGLLMSGSALALAQDDTMVYCNGLSDDDCQLLKDSVAAMQTIQSVSVPAWSMNFDMELPEEPAQFSIRGSGVFMIPPSAAAMMSDLPPANSPDYMIAILDQLDAEWIEQMLSDMLMRLVVDELVMVPSDDLDVTSFEMIIKDDTVYLHALSPTGTDMWFGQPIEFAPADSEELEAALDEMRESLTGEEMTAAMDAVGDMTEMQEQMVELANQYVTATRGEDQTVDDQTVAVFTTSFDLAGFLAAPELPGLILELLQSPTFAEMEDTDFETVNETQVKFLLSTVSTVLTESSFTTEQWIGVDDKFIYKVQADMALNLDLSLLGATEEASTASFVIGYLVEMADFNAVDPNSVTVPPSFQSMDAADNFFVGSPDLIESQLELDVPISGTFDDENDKDVYSLELTAGDAIEITLESDESLTMELYGPDGFQVAEYDSYSDEALSYTAESDGVYLVVVESWEANYILTVSAAE